MGRETKYAETVSKRILDRGEILSAHPTDWIKTQIEKGFATDVLRDYYIEKIFLNGEATAVMMQRRHSPLSDEQIKMMYGR